MASKRRKAAVVRKDSHVNLRISAEQKAELTAAATHAGLSLSSWIVATALREARRQGREGA